MKKITIVFMSVLMIFASCSMDIPYDDINKNTETVEEPSNEEPKEEEPSNEEPKEEEPSNEEPKEEEPSNEEPKEEEPSNEEDDTEIVEEEPSNEEPKEEEPSNEEPKEEEPSNEDGSENNEVVCEIDENTKILGLNYFVCVDNSQTKLSPSINDESQAKKDTFLIRGYASKYIEIRVGYKNKKLNFSSVSDSYIITDVMKKDSTINITIEWK